MCVAFSPDGASLVSAGLDGTVVNGIVTGTTLAVARAAGETAPLLFTCALAGQLVSWNPALSTASIPVTIFQYSESPDRNLNAQAWAAAFV